MNLISLREIRARLPRSRSTLYDEINRNVFPRPIKIGRGSFWGDHEIDSMLAAYAANSTQEDLRTLCEFIHAQRAEGRPVLDLPPEKPKTMRTTSG